MATVRVFCEWRSIPSDRVGGCTVVGGGCYLKPALIFSTITWLWRPRGENGCVYAEAGVGGQLADTKYALLLRYGSDARRKLFGLRTSPWLLQEAQEFTPILSCN